ncbi:MAG: hypothetical protein HZA93_10745 [Verrucomicrobia bacterium]|nr:hypothetical protein [Verrucomicrobiota bacterium]
MNLPLPPRVERAAPASPLDGAIVYARIEDSGSQIEAIFDVAGTTDARSLLFPVFGPRSASGASVLSGSRFYAHLDGQPIAEIEVAPAPANAPAAPSGMKIFWFKFAAEARVETGERVTLKLSYWQPHLGGRLYYLPMGLPPTDARDWRYVMVVRSLNSIVSPDIKQDTERIGDLSTVFLRSAKTVAIPVGVGSGPASRPGAGASKARAR